MTIQNDKKSLVKKMVEIKQIRCELSKKKEKDQFTMPSYVAGPRPRRELFSST